MARRNGCGGRWPAVALTLALATLLAGCALPSLPPLPWQQQTHGPTPLPDAQQVAHVALLASGEAADMLDPGRSIFTVSGQAQLLSLLYSGLFTFDSSLRPVPALASSYNVSADGLRYTFHLRAGARFAEGTPLTSADVAFSLNRAMSSCEMFASQLFTAIKDEPAYRLSCPAIAPPGTPVVTTLIGDALLTPDAGTLVIVLSRPDAALPAKLAEPYSVVLEQSLVTRYGKQWTTHLADGGGKGTSGAYTIASWRPWGPRTDGSLTLARAPNYWGQRPQLRRVVVALRTRINVDSPVTFTISTADDIVFDTFPSVWYSSQTTSKDLVYHTSLARGSTTLALTPTVAPLDDARVRQALALALDKTALAKVVDGVATNRIVPPGTGAYPSSPLSGPFATAPLTGDVAQAQALWQSYVQDRCGGVASRCPILTIDAIDFDEPTPLAQAISARWRTTLPGLRVVILVFSGILSDSTIPVGAAHIVPWLEDYPDPQDWLSVFSLEPGSMLPPDPEAPYTHETQADALVAQAEATRDPDARLLLYQQAENTLVNDVLAIPIAQEQDSWAVKPTVVNFPANPSPWIPPAVWARIYLTAPART